MSRSLRPSHFLVLVFFLHASALANGGPSIAELRERAEAAYVEMEFEAALDLVEEGLARCGSECPAEERARLLVTRGTIVHAANGDEQAARDAYREALALHEGVTLDPMLSNPTVERIFAEAKAEVRAGADEAGEPEAQASPRTVRRVVKWNRGFVEAGYSLTMASAHSNMRAASTPTLANPGDDPQLDGIPENDSYVLPGTRGCSAPDGEYCVRVTDGLMAFAHGLHLGGGYFLSERFGLGARLRWNPEGGSGPLSNFLLGVRAYLQLTEPKLTGFHGLVFAGAMVGQIQVQPRQNPTPPATEVERPWVRTGLGGLEVGAKLAYRFTPNVGIFASPELYALFPHFSLGLQATVGLDVTFGTAEHVILETVSDPYAVIDEDGDGIPDDRDQCPGEPEDFDRFQDEDGCPDPDNDGDGIPDDRDRCPFEAEDFDGFEDEDGCPEKDNDGDGVFDVDDQCPLEPGPALNAGCPIPDRDGDGVADRFDNCPDEAGSPENMGCPIPQLVQIEERRLKILDAIYFKRNGRVIDQRSYALLDQLAHVIREHPEIAHVRIEGHTDSTGSAEFNRKLSQHRAEAVMQYLIKSGNIDSHRLSAHGFGRDRPIHPEATTEEEHAENRRVEFVTLME